ncbi:hypothetical protein HDV00_006391 [Rhizophlyctis rosea]|nr:hypothetical protein HDV00_006391 [Rhizophlyctis rosea]
MSPHLSDSELSTLAHLPTRNNSGDTIRIISSDAKPDQSKDSPVEDAEAPDVDQKPSGEVAVDEVGNEDGGEEGERRGDNPEKYIWSTVYLGGVFMCTNWMIHLYEFGTCVVVYEDSGVRRRGRQLERIWSGLECGSGLVEGCDGDEGGGALILASTFPTSLLEPSIYSFTTTLSFTLLSTHLGRYIDTIPRLPLLKSLLYIHHLSIAAAALLLWCMSYTMLNAEISLGATYATYAAATCVGVLVKGSGIGVLVSVERDWVVVLAGGHGGGGNGGGGEFGRRRGGAGGNRGRLAGIMSLSLLLIAIFLLLPRAYRLCPPLAEPKIAVGEEVLVVGKEEEEEVTVLEGEGVVVDSSGKEAVVVEESKIRTEKEKWGRVLFFRSPPSSRERKPSSLSPASDASLPLPRTKLLTQWRLFVRNPTFLTSLSMAMSQFTIISFTSIMTTYMVFHDQGAWLFSGMRSLGVCLGILAVITYRFVLPRFGVVYPSFIGISIFVVGSIPVVVAVWAGDALGAGLETALIYAGLCASRVGLNCFRMAQTQVVQERVSQGEIGVFSSLQYALENLFDLGGTVTTIIWPNPQDFMIPLTISFGMQVVGLFTFIAFLFKDRKRRADVAQ